MKETKIELHKGKLLTLLILSGIFVLASLFFIVITLQERASTTLFVFGLTMGLLGALFFGATTLFFAKKYQDTQLGLVINATGITDNSSFISVGFIPWKDIDSISELMVKGQQFIRIHIKDSKKYTQQAKPFTKRMLLRLNARFYGSPIQISCNSLKTNHQELLNLIEGALTRSRSSNQ